MKWFPFFITCSDLVEGKQYPAGVNCCRGCHQCGKKRDQVIMAPPSKDNGLVEQMDDYEGGTPIGRIMLSFCCNVGFLALSRDEIARLVWNVRRKIAAAAKREMERETSTFGDDVFRSLGEVLGQEVIH